MKEIINIPDNIPKDLIDRAECVIVLPSVKKLAIGIGVEAPGYFQASRRD
jgi:SH3 domain-containing YSC84-like protein 1